MASYFDDHGLEDPSRRQARSTTSTTHPSVEHFLAPRSSTGGSSYASAPAEPDRLSALASMFINLRQERQGDAEATEEAWFQNIIAQLFEEAQGMGKTGPPPASKDFIASLSPLSTDQLDAGE